MAHNNLSVNGGKPNKQRPSFIMVFGLGFIVICVLFVWLAYSLVTIQTGLKGKEAVGNVTFAEKTSDGSRAGCRYGVEVIEQDGTSVGVQFESTQNYSGCNYSVGQEVNVTYYKSTDGSSVDGHVGSKSATLVQGILLFASLPTVVLAFIIRKALKNKNKVLV